MQQTATPRGARSIDGVLNLWKPVGMTSNTALLKVRKLTQIRKAGHVGILDTHAAGLLPICFGRATRIVQYLQLAPKTYRGVIRLGVSTDTQDAQGRVVEERPVPPITDAQLEAVLRAYRGPIMQQPPMYSALKYRGKRLYSLARQGIVVDRPRRQVTIHEFTVQRLDDCHLRFEVTCSTGTYVRTLSHDIGQDLGCGAHLKELTRVTLGPFTEANAVSLETLEHMINQFTGMEEFEASILAIDEVLAFLPATRVERAAEMQLRHGGTVSGANLLHIPDGGFEKGEALRLQDAEGRLLAIGEALISSAHLSEALISMPAARPKCVLAPA